MCSVVSVVVYGVYIRVAYHNTHTHFDVIYGEDRQSVLCIHKYYSAILLLLILDITCGYVALRILSERTRTAFPNRKHARKRTRTHGGLFGI